MYTAPCIMFLMHAYPLRGEVGGGWALEFETFWALWNGIEPIGECHLGPLALSPPLMRDICWLFYSNSYLFYGPLALSLPLWCWHLMTVLQYLLSLLWATCSLSPSDADIWWLFYSTCYLFYGPLALSPPLMLTFADCSTVILISFEGHLLSLPL